MDGLEQVQSISNPHLRMADIFENLDIAESTRLEYGYRIKSFLSFVLDYGLNNKTYLEYKRYLNTRNDLSISSKNKYLVVGRIYCKELHRIGAIPIDITANIKLFKENRRHKRFGFNDEEMNNIIAYLQKLQTNRKNTRIKAIIALLALQGLRQIEIVRLNVNDLQLNLNQALILGKGKDDKELIDLHPITVQALKTYLMVNKLSAGPLFISTSNNSQNARLTTKSIRNLINPILNELGIDKALHAFRHYFVTKLIQKYNSDLIGVSKFTRHKNLEMLQIYNDNVKRKEDLPRFYDTFNQVIF